MEFLASYKVIDDSDNPILYLKRINKYTADSNIMMGKHKYFVIINIFNHVLKKSFLKFYC